MLCFEKFRFFDYICMYACARFGRMRLFLANKALHGSIQVGPLFGILCRDMSLQSHFDLMYQSLAFFLAYVTFNFSCPGGM